ncbi:hypothetical protein [Kitasatospora sp. NPDC056181]
MAEDGKDQTLSDKYAGTETTIDGEEHLIIREDQVPVRADDE